VSRHFHRWVAVCAAAGALLTGGPAAADPARPLIVGGSPASPGEYPAQGWLVVDKPPDPGFDMECGGSLVGSRWFLTAAHCVLGGTDFAVLLGDHDVTPPNADWYDVTAVDIKSDYNPATLQNDVAMLKLDRPAPYQFLRVIGTDESAAWAPGAAGRIIGWGTTSEGGDPSDVLLEADVPIVSDSTCFSAYSFNVPPMDPATMFCAGDGVHDTCEGDSGGPLMVRDAAGGWVLAGITSWGEGCARANYPGVYARIGAPSLNAWVMARHPRASFTTGAAHTGMPAAFTSTSFHPEPDGFTSFVWDFNGDGVYTDGFGANASSVFTTPGPRVVGLVASRPGGDTAVARQVVHVNGTPSIEAGGPPNFVVEGGRVVLRATGSDPEGQPVAYAWDLDGNGSFETPGLNPTFSAAGLDGPLVRTVTLQACDQAGACVRDPGIVQVANANPRVNAGPNRRTRRGRRVRFRLRSFDPGPDRITVSWRFGDGKRARGRVTSHVYRRPGRYRVRVWVRDDDGGGAVDFVIVRVRR
jgi:secreted trypsin-like serine protease